MNAAENYQFVKLALDTLHFAVTALLTVYIFVSERRRVTRQAMEDRLSGITTGLDKLRYDTHERFDIQSDRLARTDQDVAHLKDQQKEHGEIFRRVNALSEELASTRAATRSLEGSLVNINRQLEIVNQFLLEHGR